MIGLHGLHQLEESISFFNWYVENEQQIPKSLLLTSIENGKTVINHPEYFALSSFAQLFFVTFIAFVFRQKEKTTKHLQIIYLLGISFFLVWHIVISYIAHSYAPIMVTCIGGLFLILYLAREIFVLNKSNDK